MTTITEIESLTRAYAAARAKLAGIVQELQDEIETARRWRIAHIKRAVAATADAHAGLAAAIQAGADLFVRPRTITVDGVKVGMQQQKAHIEFDDEQTVIARIRERLPADQAALLIRVRESVDRNAVADLTEADLRRIGIRVVAGQDQVLIKPTDTEVDKLVDALLRDAERLEEEAA